MKKVAPVISILFHPLIMPSLGLLLLLNSGTYISLLDPAAKKAILFVMALGTLLFPLMMIPILYYRKLMTSLHNSSREERLISQFIILILYIITFVYFVRLPLSRVIHGYVLGVVLTFGLVIIANFWVKISLHTTALGGIVGLIIALIFLYETPLQGMLMLAILAGGITGSARLVLGNEQSAGIYSGYLVGMMVVLITLLVF